MSHSNSDSSSSRILVVDDERIMCELLQFNLENEGYAVNSCYSSEDALKLDLSSYNLFILDVMMGEMSGLKLANIIKERRETSHIPIIFCSAKDREDDVIAGLNSGADDYVKKPFSMREMIARVRTVLRRQTAVPPQPENKLRFKDLVIDMTAHTAKIAGEHIGLTRTEFDILALFMGNINRFYSRNEIFDHVWPEQVIVTDRTIDVNISRIRKKLGQYASHIVNRSGFGYGFVE